MSAYILILRKADAQSGGTFLGVYSSWQNGWIAFFERWRRGGYPFVGGRLPFDNRESFNLAIAQGDIHMKTVLIYSNDSVKVVLEKTAIDAPVVF